MPIVRARIDKCMGRVNNLAFDRGDNRQGLGNLGYPIGTVLFIGAHEEPTDRDTGGLISSLVARNSGNFTPYGRTFDVKFSFLYRNNGVVAGSGAGAVYAGHNFLYRGPGYSPQFQLATSDGTSGGKKIYGTAELNMLWHLNLAVPLPTTD